MNDTYTFEDIDTVVWNCLQGSQNANDYLAYVQNGDRIRLSVANRELSLLVSDQELARRQEANPAVAPTAQRGYQKLFLDSVLQADKGADFDFLMPPQTSVIPK